MTALTYLRAETLHHISPTGSGWRAILRRVKADLVRARAPTPAFDPSEGWQQVEAMAKLRRVVDSMKNCVASLRAGGDHHMRQFFTGEAVFLAQQGPSPKALFYRECWASALDHVPDDDYWRSVRIIGCPGGLDGAGSEDEGGGATLTLLTDEPLRAMGSIAWQARVRTDDADELDDVEDAA